MAHSIYGTLSPFIHRPRFLTRPPSLSLGVYFLSSRTRAFNHERNIVAIPHSHRQHWTVPVSREETLAIREKFQKIDWRPPNLKTQDEASRDMGKECLG
jgi:hypothetical protein